MKFIFAAAAAASLAFLGASPSLATTYTYTLSGTATGTLAGVGFTDTSFVFTLVGDSANYTTVFPEAPYFNPLTSVSFTIGATSGSIENTGFGSYNYGPGFHGTYWGKHSNGVGFADIFDTATPAPIDLLSTTAPTSAAVFWLSFSNIATSAGALSLTAASNVMFSGGPSGVPEPASWAMLIAGFGLIGAAARRRRMAVGIA